MEDKCTSLELGKKLKEAGCEIQTSNVYGVEHLGELENYDEKEIQFFTDEKIESIYNRYGNFVTQIYPAFDILNDICCGYAKEIWGEYKVNKFGEKVHKLTSEDYKKLENENNDLFYKAGNTFYTKQDEKWEFTASYKYHSKQVLELMQQGRKKTVEKYIWENCRFNPNNIAK